MFLKTLCLCFFLFCSTLVNAQTFSTATLKVSSPQGTESREALVFLPPNFSTAKKYPLVIYTHGVSQAGSDLNLLYSTGLPKVLKDGYRPSFEFIMVAVQSPTYSVSPLWLPSILEWSKTKWNLDTNRLYLTGISAGGWAAFGSQLNISPQFGARFAAIAVLSGGTQDVNRANIAWWSDSKTPLWAVVGARDLNYLSQNTELINEINKRVPSLATLTVREGYGHGGWNHVYAGSVTNSGKTIWEWLYQFDRSNPLFPHAGEEGAEQPSSLTLASTTTTTTSKALLVNLFWGSNPPPGTEWNNWKVSTTATFPNLKYTDGQTSTVTTAIINSSTVIDNGSTYSTTGMVIPQVLRYASRSDIARTLTITGLSPNKVYDLEFFASRNAEDIDATWFTVDTSIFIIATDKNRTNKATFLGVAPDASGKISVYIKSAKAFNYLNGFTIRESATTEFVEPKSVTIPAVSYANMGGVLNASTTDIGVGQGVSYIDNGDWMDYMVEAPQAGVYTLTMRLASGNDGGQFIIKNTLGKSLATIYVPNTGGYQTWRNVSIALPLDGGLQTLRFQSTSPTRWNFNRFHLTNVATGQRATPISKSARQIQLGTVVEAENYMSMYGVTKYITSDFAGGTQNTTSIDLNDWMNFHITTPAAGLHILNLRIASYVSDAQFHIKDSSGKILATVAVPNTGGWQTWRDVTAQVTLPAGAQTLTIHSASTGKWNFNFFEIARTPLNASASYRLKPSSGTSIYLPAGLNLNHLKGGDTLNIPGGNYHVINIGNFRGAAGNPIIIRNKGGVVNCTVLNLTGTAEYFSLQGNGVPGITYGFKIDGNNTTGNGLFAYGKGIEISYTEISRSTSGIFMKRNPDAADPVTVHPNYLMNDIYIHHNYVHDILGEAMYIGHTGADGGQGGNPLLPVRMQNVEIAYNILERIGWDGIQLSNATTGNKIHHNTITNYGTVNKYSQQAGIILGGNTSGDVYDNTIKNGTGNAIQNFGYGLNKIYNNYIDNVGNNGTAKGLEAIYCNDIVLSSELRPKQQMQVNNNTIKYPHIWGAIRVSGYNQNSLPATMQYNKLLIPNAPSDWEKKYFHTYVPNSIISNNTLIAQ